MALFSLLAWHHPNFSRATHLCAPAVGLASYLAIIWSMTRYMSKHLESHLTMERILSGFSPSIKFISSLKWIGAATQMFQIQIDSQTVPRMLYKLDLARSQQTIVNKFFNYRTRRNVPTKMQINPEMQDLYSSMKRDEIRSLIWNQGDTR